MKEERQKKCLFRTEAGSKIGLGHFSRCRALALKLFLAGYEVKFCGPGLEFERFFGQETSFELLPAYSEEKASFIEACLEGSLLKSLSGGFLILDSYSFSGLDFKLMSNACKKHAVVFVVIDDLADREIQADFLINPNPAASDSWYADMAIKKVFTGASYTLIRPEITDLKRTYDPSGPVLITLGGSQAEKDLIALLETVPDEYFRKIYLSFPSATEKLESYVSDSSLKLVLNRDSAKFPELLTKASLAVTAGGTALWEVCCLGLPCAVHILLDNQRKSVKTIKEHEIAFLLDSPLNLGSLLLDFERNPEKFFDQVPKQKALIDGKGAERAVKNIFEAKCP